MRELALNILDIAKNSTKAGAKTVLVEVLASTKENLLEISISDDGKGMSEEFIKNVLDPFTTTRTTRKVGMGLPLFEMSATQTGGSFDIWSKVGEGTKVTAKYVLDSIDRMPLGDLSGTMVTLIMGDDISFELKLKLDEREFFFQTKEVKEIMGDVDIKSMEVLSFIGDYLKENITEIFGGNL